MLTREINSLQHPIAKYLVKLREERSFRTHEKKVVIMGNKLVTEIARHTPLEMLFAIPGTRISSETQQACKEIIYVSDAFLKKVTDLEKPEPLAAVVAIPSPASLKGKQFLIALDGVSDPGNMGTILRSALALGWEGAFIVSSSTDPFNAKALRASRGAPFHLPICTGSHEDLHALIQDNHMNVLIADTEGHDVETGREAAPLLLVLGSESHGPRFAPSGSFKRVTIPMNQDVESLNVASAAAILMYALKR